MVRIEMVGSRLAVNARHVECRERDVHEEGEERVPDVHDEGYALRQKEEEADYGYGDVEVGQPDVDVSW